MRPSIAFAVAAMAGLAFVAGAERVASETASDPAVAAFASLQPSLLTRSEWKAKPAMPGLKSHTPSSIVVHHTGVARNGKIGLERKLQNLQSFSQSRAPVGARVKPPWPDIPYHFYIDMTGRIGEARDPAFAGDSNTKYDLDGHIQVVVEGDFEKEKPSKAQLEALAGVLLWLSARWNVPVERISMHKDNAETDCPGAHLIAVLPKLIAGIKEQRAEAIAKLCASSPAADLAARYCAPR